MKKIILASNSPRRKELLSLLQIPFSVIVSNIDERALEQTLLSSTPAERAVKTAYAKAETICTDAQNDTIVIAADTIVVFGEQILHKPQNEQQAFDMLQMLSGHTHTVYTGMTILYKNTQGQCIPYETITATAVTFRKLQPEEISAYIATGEPFDKAGGYGIQGKGAFLVDHIEGEYPNVVGLSITAVYDILKKCGVDVTKFW